MEVWRLDTERDDTQQDYLLAWGWKADSKVVEVVQLLGDRGPG